MRTYKNKPQVHELIENVQDLCRLCLQKAENAFIIFDDANNFCSTIKTRIMICVGMEVTKDEALPNQICANCYNELQRYYKFRKKCEISYHRLKSHLRAIKDKELVNAVSVLCTNTQTQGDSYDVDHNTVQNISEEVSVADNKCNILTENVDNPIESGEPSNILMYLCKMLPHLGILVEQDGELVLADNSLKNLQLEMGDGAQIMFELSEEIEPDSNICKGVQEESSVIRLSTNLETDDQMNRTASPQRDLEPILQENLENNQQYLKFQANEVLESDETEKDLSPSTQKKKYRGVWCKECGKQYSCPSALARHRVLHSGRKPYECEHCGRTFAQQDVLTRHARLHTGERPYKCQMCPKSFTQRSGLTAHTRMHLPPDARPLKLHECTRCPKLFLYASGLHRHAQSHDGVRFLCTVCDKQFRDRSSYKRHLQTKHGNKQHALET